MVTSSSIYVCALFVCMPCVVTSLGMVQDKLKLETSAEEETRVIGAGTFCAARVFPPLFTHPTRRLSRRPLACRSFARYGGKEAKEGRRYGARCVLHGTWLLLPAVHACVSGPLRPSHN
jgi:hypothetical protein